MNNINCTRSRENINFTCESDKSIYRIWKLLDDILSTTQELCMFANWCVCERALNWQYSVRYAIIMLMKFADLSQSDRSNWVMWQVKDPCPRPSIHKKCKNLDDIAAYWITSLKSKWKNIQMKNMNIEYDNCIFIYVLQGNLQWNSWFCKMIDYLRGSVVKFDLNSKNAFENKSETI